MKKILYILLFCGWYVMSLLPLRVLYLFSDLMFPVMYYVVRYRREIIRENITNSFPDKTYKERIAIEKKHYRFFCDQIVETIKEFSISPKEMSRRMEFRGLDEACSDLEASPYAYVFLYLGHYCNWEWISSLGIHLPDNQCCAQIYHPLRNAHFNNLFLHLRGRFGAESIAMHNTLRRLLSKRKEGRKAIIGFISDQAPKWPGINYFVPFLQRETAALTGSEQIGRKVGALYYYGEVERVRRGYYVCHIRKMEAPESTDCEYPITTMYMERLEQQILERPEFWLWSHKRWKRTKEEYMAVCAMESDPKARVQLLMHREWLREHGYEVK